MENTWKKLQKTAMENSNEKAPKQGRNKNPHNNTYIHNTSI